MLVWPFLPAARCRPSTAFCRALDAEEEYNDIDEMATGMIARRHGSDAPPPLHMQARAWPACGWCAAHATCMPSLYDCRLSLCDLSAAQATNTPPPCALLFMTALQVPDDNPFEEHLRRQEAAAAGTAQHPAGMEVEEAPGEGASGEPAELQQQGSSLRSALSSPRASGEARLKKQVRFEGVAAPWVPPARRPGYQLRCGRF